MERHRIITDTRVLDADFVPNDIVHRDAEINALSSALEPVTRGKTAEHALLVGPSGAGKTCVARYAVDQLRETVIDVNTQYVNCWQDYSRFKTLYRVLEGLNQTLDVYRQSTPTDELLDRLHTYDGLPYVVILDEVDQLDDTDVLYDLVHTPKLGLVLIANREEELFQQLDDRVVSRLQTATRIRFDAYDTETLVEILEDRVQWGLRPDVITSEQLEIIAETAAGDARVAIGILRGAARHASQKGADTIADTHIDETVSHSKAEIKRKDLQKLNTDQRLLYDIIADHDEIRPGDLYDEYEQQAPDPKTKRMVRYYLQKMSHYNLIVADGENRGRTYRVRT